MFLLLVMLCAHGAFAAPLHMLRIRNLVLLFVEAPNGEVVDVLYAAGGDKVGDVVAPTEKAERDLTERDTEPLERMESRNNHQREEESEEFDPILDGPRVESSVIQAPRFRPPCESGHRKDRHGKCRRIW
ncbi:Hypothetical protein NTJ_11935 [Nesidiocoris tenuis]|uniref:Secreted protein n=1 Tax=Nesidiocoris tenuis TaxID=355587 RepID=A0ABN7B692_9HEMI|nr:Hypothetical protein NTJ_11935 [Nesidiocoris tenuis]